MVYNTTKLGVYTYSIVRKKLLYLLVKAYSKDDGIKYTSKWNGKIILLLVKDYTKIEEPIANLRPT